MDGFVFLLLLGLTFGFFAGAYRASGKAPQTAAVFAVLAAFCSVLILATIVADQSGVVFETEAKTAYLHTQAANMEVAPAPPAFSFTFDTSAGTSGFHQSRYIYKASNDDEFSWAAEHGGSIKVVADTSRDDRFNGIYMAKIEREAGHEWSTLEFDYRIQGQPGRHGLEVAWSCDACFLSLSDTIVSDDASTADSGWQHASLNIPITEKDLIIAWVPPLISAQNGLYSERTIWLDNIEIRTAGLTVSNETTGTPIEHGDSSAGRFVLTGATETTTFELISPTESNRVVAGGLFTAWTAYLVLFVFGQMPALLGGRRF